MYSVDEPSARQNFDHKAAHFELQEDTAHPEGDSDEFDEDGDHCSICLQLYNDRTVIPDCSHEFCYDCIVTWAGTPFLC